MAFNVVLKNSFLVTSILHCRVASSFFSSPCMHLILLLVVAHTIRRMHYLFDMPCKCIQFFFLLFVRFSNKSFLIRAVIAVASASVAVAARFFFSCLEVCLLCLLVCYFGQVLVQLTSVHLMRGNKLLAQMV